jgi:hypothetical protein
MSFHVWSLNLVLEIAEAVRELSLELFSGPRPEFLHHYTSATTVEAIAQSRSLWATCVNDQSDQTEITHASGLVMRLAEAVSDSGTPAFATDVLKRLPFYMEERKQWIYIACFCDDHDSALHWKTYGAYRLTFPSPWTGVPSLALSDIQADCWYQRVIYDEGLQERAIERALGSSVLAISRNTSGANMGPWAKAMVDNCARNAAQLLLSLAVAFKQRSFQDEKEWRIVCAPRLGSNSSAPGLIDENFNANVKQSPRRHLLLQVRRELLLFQPVFIAPVPFLNWAQSPSHVNSQEIDRINNVLKANHRTDLIRPIHHHNALVLI